MLLPFKRKNIKKEKCAIQWLFFFTLPFQKFSCNILTYIILIANASLFMRIPYLDTNDARTNDENSIKNCTNMARIFVSWKIYNNQRGRLWNISFFGKYEYRHLIFSIQVTFWSACLTFIDGLPTKCHLFITLDTCI